MNRSAVATLRIASLCAVLASTSACQVVAPTRPRSEEGFVTLANGILELHSACSNRFQRIGVMGVAEQELWEAHLKDGQSLAVIPLLQTSIPGYSVRGQIERVLPDVEYTITYAWSAGGLGEYISGPLGDLKAGQVLWAEGIVSEAQFESDRRTIRCAR